MLERKIPIKISERLTPCRLPAEYWAENILLGVIKEADRPKGCCLWAKRMLDVIVSAAGIFILSPILVLIGLTVKLTSKGPILYRQNRCGQYGSIFSIYKFRSMRTDAEKHSGPQWAMPGDKRATVIGKYMRLTHIDEIPQLVNVLKGEMSLVGPRPERPEFVYSLHNLVPNYEKRLLVKPGLTGWAQIRHRYDTVLDDVRKKLRYDLFYVKKMCLAVDVKVIVQTASAVLLGNAKGV